MIGYSLAALAAASGTPCPEQSAKPLIADQQVTAPMFYGRYQPFVMVSVNDLPDMLFMFDTGAQSATINIEYADQMGMENLGANLSHYDGGGNLIPGYITCLRNFEVSGETFGDFRASASVYEDRTHIGITGQNSFWGSLVVFDGPKMRLTIEPRGDAEPAGYRYANDPSYPTPLTNLRIGSLDMDAKIDTGSHAELIMPLWTLEALPLAAEPVKAGTVHFVTGSADYYRIELTDPIEIAGAVIDVENVIAVDIAQPLIGFALLKRMRVTMDPERGVSWVETNPDVAE